MLNIALPVVMGVLDILKGRRGDIAAKTGVAEQVVGRVLGAAEDFATRDEKLQAQVFAQMKDARAHDAATFDKTDLAANRLRSSVRPLVTFLAMGWYIYARVAEIPLTPEDYAIIGGILAFWFGFRPFEKQKK